MMTETRPTPVQRAVGIAELVVTDEATGALVAYGIGSCIILCAWDALRRVAGMAHIVQPWSPDGRQRDARYADQAVPLLLRRLSERGAQPSRLVVKMSGGASLLVPGARAEGEPLGTLNARAVEQVLPRYGLRVVASDVGGRHGRTISLDAATGSVLVRTLGRTEITL